MTEMNKKNTKDKIEEKKPERKKKDLLTIKEKEYLKILPTVKSKKEALMKAGYTEKTALNACQIENNIERKIGKNAIYDVMQKAGMTDEFLLKKHMELIEAKKPIIVNGKVKATPDNQVRAKVLELAYKLGGALKETDQQGDTTINILSGQSSILLQQIIARIEKKDEKSNES